jgi:ankyrin repeat protein
MKNRFLLFTLILLFLNTSIFAFDINPVKLEWYHIPLIPFVYVISKVNERYNNFAKIKTSNALHYYAEKEQLNDSDFTQIQSQIQSGIDINQKNYEGNAPLFLALMHLTSESKIRFIEVLLKKGADLNLKNKQNQSVIDLIRVDLKDDNYSKGNSRWIKAVSLLLDYKLNINQTRLDSKTLLQHALEEDNLEMAIFLLERGFTLNIKTKDDTNPILSYHWLFFGDDREVKRALDLTLKMLKVFVAKGGNLNAENSTGSVLHHACFSNNNIEVIRFLLKNGASQSVNHIVREDTPLHRTIFHMTHKDSLVVVKLLLENGADVNLKNGNGETALDVAKENAVSGFSKEERDLAFKAIKLLQTKVAK